MPISGEETGFDRDPRYGRRRRDSDWPAVEGRESVVVALAQEADPYGSIGQRGPTLDRVVRFEVILAAER